MKKRLRIPKRTKLPFGYIVQYNVLSQPAWIERYHEHFTDELSAETYAFTYECENGWVICLNRQRGMRRLRADLLHEWIHVVGDWQAANLSIPSLANPVG